MLGADGMLGHELVRQLHATHEVHASVRRTPDERGQRALKGASMLLGFDARQPDQLPDLLSRLRPDVILNCVGIVKQRHEAKEAIDSITVNALFPHQLLAAARVSDTRVIHLSTDCVFSGRTGGYSEDDIPDPVDLYGRTKLLGELAEAPGLTLRTSIIGLELGRQTSLVEWFLAQRGEVRGFTEAIYSGLTTMEMARCIAHLMEQHPRLTGVWHVSAEPIDKFTLLQRLVELLGRTDIVVHPDTDFTCDRSLRSERFTDATGYQAPKWESMLSELAERIAKREART